MFTRTTFMYFCLTLFHRLRCDARSKVISASSSSIDYNQVHTYVHIAYTKTYTHIRTTLMILYVCTYAHTVNVDIFVM